ncbi:MAG TPA: hypothetical protein DDX85_11435 [Nitrospiraceae bacterium]|nr:hypothetical protein [Nitrospiraceae bacterium]
MKTRARNILLYDKTILVLSFAILLALILTIMSVMYSRNLEGKNEQLRDRLSEMRSMSGDVLQIKAAVESKETKIGLKKASGIVSALEQILSTHGLEAKVIKPLGKTKVDEFTEDSAELEIESTDLNSIVNLLYKIDISPVPLKIKTVSVRSTFEDPDKFILKLTVSLMSRG